MAVKIGHAAIDENGKIAGGLPGDQTFKEVCTRNWYNGNWKFLARPKDASVAEKIAATCEAGCENPNIGYDQNQRNTLLTQAKAVDYDLSKIANVCETDCSAFASVCVLAAGVNLAYSTNLPTTSNLKSRLTDTGAFEILTDSKYLSSDNNLQRGDILVKPGSHAVIVLGNGTPSIETPVVKSTTALPVLKKGSKGASVKALQILLIGNYCPCGKAGADGEFGSSTQSAVKKYQKENNLGKDGVVGPATWGKLLGVQ